MHVVILRPLKIGDFLTAVPAYRGIRRAFPHSRITLAAPRELRPLVELLDGAIDDLVHVRGVERLPHALAQADVGIDLHGEGPASHRQFLDAGVRRLIAFRHPMVLQTAGGPAYDPQEHEVARWCRMLAHFGIVADPDDLDLRSPSVVVPRRVRGATLIHPGASSEARCWPVDRWIAVARAERRQGRPVIITGGRSEVERAGAIASAADVPATHNFVGRTNLNELAALVAASARVVCGDTGTAHLATAFRRPSVVLFGPTPPSGWGPPPRPYHRVLWNGTVGNPHASRIDPGLQAISAHRVIATLQELTG